MHNLAFFKVSLMVVFDRFVNGGEEWGTDVPANVLRTKSSALFLNIRVNIRGCAREHVHTFVRTSSRVGTRTHTCAHTYVRMYTPDHTRTYTRMCICS